VSGALDEICPPALQEELAATVPHGRLERVECGHMSPLEAPGEVAVLLAEWVA
jgi:pimeloyl-ACP methyl ester carboxylesterase